jgi:D-aminopeptidase
VRAALAAADTGPVAEGTVGAGTGTSCFGWKGGVGAASRLLPHRAGGYTIGALVQTNYGRPEELIVAGVPVGRHLQPPGYGRIEPDEISPSQNSIMIVLATDAPLDARQLGRLCRRATFGLARTGSVCHGGSGDFVIAFSTAVRTPDRPQRRRFQRPAFHLQGVMGDFALGVIEAVEEAIYNSLLTATTVVGRDGNTRHALPVEELARVMGRYGR